MKKAICLVWFYLFSWVVFTSFFLFFSPSYASAGDIVLNEVFANPVNEDDEFIELFNKGSQAVALTNWKIADKVKTFVIPTITLDPHAFYVLDKSATGISLNNSGGEDVFLKDQSDQLIDSFTYDAAIEGKSWARHPDGDGSFFNDIALTKGSENSGPTPTVTPTPPSTPTPTKTPTPTLTPTPTKVPTATPQLSPTSKPTVAIIVKKPSPTNVLGTSTKSAVERLSSPTPSKKPTPTVAVQGVQTKADVVPLLFIGGGILLLVSYAILTFRPQLKKLWKRE